MLRMYSIVLLFPTLVAFGCDADPCDTEDAWAGNAFVRDMTEADALLGIECITGSLIVGEMEHDVELTGTGIQSIEVGTEVFHLDALEDLVIVEGDAHIAGNVFLTSIDGLSGLTSVGRELRWFDDQPRGDFILHQNLILSNVDGLSGLETVGANLILSGHDELTDASGLENVKTVGWEYRVIDNPVLPADDAKKLGSDVRALGGFIVANNGSAIE